MILEEHRVAPSGSYVDLPAVIGGAVIAAALASVFTTFGGAIGLSTVSVEAGEGSASVWMIVTTLWVLFTIAMSFLAGGYVTGRLRRRLDAATSHEIAARDGLNGLVVWGLGTLVGAWMIVGAVGTTVSAVSNVAGSAANAVGTAVGGVASGVGQAAGGVVSATGSAVGGVVQGVGTAVSGIASNVADKADTEGAMNYFTDTLLRPALDGAANGAQNPGATPARPSLDNAELSRQTGVILGHVMRTGKISDSDKNFLIAATAQRTGVSRSEVEQRVDDSIKAVQNMRIEAENALKEAKAEAARLAEEGERLAAEAQKAAELAIEEAKQAAIRAAETARKSTILTAFLIATASLIAAAAAFIGAVSGGRHRDAGRIFAGFNFL